MNPFHYSMSLLETLYGIDVPEDEFEEVALVAWNLIGNKRTRIYRYSTCMNACSDNTIELPCNADILEAVTASWEDWRDTTNTTDNGDMSSLFTEQYIEHRKDFHDPLYQGGKFIKYERVGDTLYLNRPYPKVNILYRGIILDEDGLPELTDKEALAIATYCAYAIKFKEGIRTNNAAAIQLSESLQQKWLIQCDQARTPDYINQNDIDQILDAKTNWNRKIFNKSYKIYK